MGLVVTLVALALSACGSDGGGDGEPAGAQGKLDRVVEIDGERGLYVRCTGAGSPTVVMDAGDGGYSQQYLFAEQAVSEETRACVYDRAGLGEASAETLAAALLASRVVDHGYPRASEVEL